MSNQFPNIPVVLPQVGQIPTGFRLMIHKWSFPENRIGETVTVHGQQVKKLLTLDINIPRSDFATAVNSGRTTEESKGLFTEHYPCPHRCPGCFNNAALRNPVMTLDEVIHIVDQAVELGLESVKFLGPGELLANPDLFRILDEFAKRNIVIGIFTKGAIMGHDGLAMNYHGMSSAELVRRLTAYPNTTFFVGARSFDPRFENNRFIPQNRKEYAEDFDYHVARNIAIERLCEASMNADLMKQRLAIVCAPVTAQNVATAFEIFRWGAERNIPVYIPPTMVSGKGHNLVKSAHDVKFENDYIDVAVQTYIWTIKRGIMTIEQLRHDGVHPYIAMAPCNQLTHGLYIHYDGTVLRCPGNDTPDFVVHEDVRQKSLLEIWQNSANYRVNLFNNRCVKDGLSLPIRFYSQVLDQVEKSLVM